MVHGHDLLLMYLGNSSGMIPEAVGSQAMTLGGNPWVSLENNGPDYFEIVFPHIVGSQGMTRRGNHQVSRENQSI